MKPLEVKEYFKSQYKFNVETGMSASSLGNWIRWGYVPEAAQLKIERITKGDLKADEVAEIKETKAKKRDIHHVIIEDIMRLSSMINDDKFNESNKVLAECVLHLMNQAV